MNPVVGRTLRSVGLVAGVFLLTGCGLTSCGNSKGGGDGFSQTITGEHGSKSSVLYGADAKLPKDFPSGVPIPEAGKLRVVVSEANPPNAVYTMTYSLGGRSGIEVGDRYRSRLEKAGFKIEHYSSVGGTDGDMTQYDAVGDKWDVSVVSGKANLRDRATLSVQVHTHGQLTSGIGGIGDTTPSVTVPPGASGVQVPSTDESTTTTTSGF
jgi:hypothetical protein